MKKLFIFIICIFFTLSGCTAGESDEKKEQTNIQNEEKKDTQSQIELEEEKDDNIFETKYYSLTLPDEWEGLYYYQIRSTSNGEYALNFYEKENYELREDGNLFGILLFLENEDYSYLPSYDVLGTLQSKKHTYTVVVEYPSDVQFSEDNADVYLQLSKDVDEILQTFQANQGYTFESKL